MGRRAGIILSSLGLVFMLIGLGIVVGALTAEIPAGGGGFLAVLGIAIAFMIAGVFWFIGNIMYLAAYLTTRESSSRVVGVNMILSSIIHLVFLLLLVSRGPQLNMETILFLAVPVVFMILYGVAGAKRL